MRRPQRAGEGLLMPCPPSAESIYYDREQAPEFFILLPRSTWLTGILEIRGTITRPPGLTLQRRAAQLCRGTKRDAQVCLADVRAVRDVAGLAPGGAADGLERGVRVV